MVDKDRDEWIFRQIEESAELSYEDCLAKRYYFAAWEVLEFMRAAMKKERELLSREGS